MGLSGLGGQAPVVSPSATGATAMVPAPPTASPTAARAVVDAFVSSAALDDAAQRLTWGS